LIGVLAMGLLASTTLPIPVGEDPGGSQLHSSVDAALAARTGSDTVLLEFSADDWGYATGVALTLERRDVRWYVAPKWAFVFGGSHAYSGPPTGPGLEEWFLTPPDSGHTGQIVLTSNIAIYPAPPSLAGYSPTP
jgi:hypothetical protein